MELKLASITSVSTIQDILNAKAVSKATLPKLLLLLSTYAMSFAIVERQCCKSYSFFGTSYSYSYIPKKGTIVSGKSYT